MEEQLISFETIKLAKKKGIDFRDNIFKKVTINNKAGTYHAYVTQSLLQKWLREVHNISIKIDDFHSNSKLRFDYSISILGSQEDNPQGIFETYEEALEEALQEALKTLKDKL